MSHQYQQRFQAPEQFQFILKNFTREVLRNQPSNIYEFGLDYFTVLANTERRKLASEINNNSGHTARPASTSSLSSSSSAGSRQRIHHVEEEDEEGASHGDGGDGGGELMMNEAVGIEYHSEQELTEALLNYMDDLNPSDPESILHNTVMAVNNCTPHANQLERLFVLSFFRTAYESAESVIDGYKEFITRDVGPILFHILTTNAWGPEVEEQLQQSLDLANETIKDMPALELQNEIKIMLDRSDFVMDEGYLDMRGLRKTLTEAEGLEFTEREVSVILAASYTEEASQNGGMVSLNWLVESVPLLCFYSRLFEERISEQ